MKAGMIRQVMSVFLIAVLITGCRAKKTDTADTAANSGPANTGEIVKVESTKGDLDKILSTFLGKTLEEVKKEGADYEEKDEYLIYDHDAEELTYAGKMYLDPGHTKMGPGPRIMYSDNYEMAGDKYETVVDEFEAYHVNTTVDCGLRRVLPDEELENCSREEVLERCRPYAEVLGYNGSNCEVEVYAMTLDRLKKTEDPNGAPYKGLKNAHELSPEELGKVKSPWTKGYEAFYLVYKPVINGLVMEASQCMLGMVYAPVYGKVVSASGMIPWTVKEKTRSGQLISGQEAVSVTMDLNNIPDGKDIEVLDVGLAYSQSFGNREGNNDTLTLCWRVDYKRLHSAEYSGDRAYGTELVDAVSGEECQQFPGLGG